MNTAQLYKRYRTFQGARGVVASFACVISTAGAGRFYSSGDPTRAIFWLLVAVFSAGQLSKAIDAIWRVKLSSVERPPTDGDAIQPQDAPVGIVIARTTDAYERRVTRPLSPLFDQGKDSTTVGDAAAQFPSESGSGEAQRPFPRRGASAATIGDFGFDRER
jgi:hypothetical protein